MVSNLILSSLSLLLGVVYASPMSDSTGSLQNRANFGPIWIDVTSDGGCAGEGFGYDITPGVCQTFQSNYYGIKVQMPQYEMCVLKFYAGNGCTGQATTWGYLTDEQNGVSNTCTSMGNHFGNLVIGGGIRSVIANCADDYHVITQC